MLFAQVILFSSVCGLASCLSVPTRRDDPPAGISVKVNLTSNPQYSSDGPTQHRRSLEKYDVLSKRRLQDRDANTWNGAVTYHNGRYLCPVGIEGKTFSFEFDTGSADFWVLSTLTSSSDIVGTHTLYDPAASNSSVRLDNYTWQVGYNDQSGASGVVYKDIVTFNQMEVANQPIEVPETMFGNLVGAPLDGILGLAIGPNHVIPSDVPTFLQNLLHHPLQSSLFTTMLARPNEVIQSFVTFGMIDESFVNGKNISYAPIITSQGFWQFPSTYVISNGQPILRASNNTAIIDSGTTLILVDDTLLSEIYEPIGGFLNTTINGGAGAWVFPTNATLPALTLPMGQVAVTLLPADLRFADLGDGWAYGSLQSRGHSTFDIYGDVWLANVYAIFDLTDLTVPRIGVVPRGYNAV